MNKEDKLQYLKEQLEKIEREMEELNKPETAYIVVTKHRDSNWYTAGEVYKVFTDTQHYEGTPFYPLVSNKRVGVNTQHCFIITDAKAIAALDATDIQERQ